jgi:hypothetical protein
MTEVNSTRSVLCVHFADIWDHMKKFGTGMRKNPEVAVNAIVSIVVSFLTLTTFCRMEMSDNIMFSDVSFVKYMLNDDHMPPVAVIPGKDFMGNVTCGESDRMCILEHPSELFPGASGIFGGGFTAIHQNEFNLPHLICVALWFSTPISLFLLANGTWQVFEQWMWWSLYLVIFIWDMFGLIGLMLLNHTSVYNKIIVFIYFMYSFLLIYSVRETWKLRYSSRNTDDDDRGMMDKRYSTGPTPVYGHSAVPVFMQKLVIGGVANASYTLADEADAELPSIADALKERDGPDAWIVDKDNGARYALAPEVITHTFTRTVLLLCEFFFIAPVIYISAYVLVQERVMPMDVQTRFWQTSVMFGVIVLMEKSRKTRLSYVTDTVLSMASLVSLLAVSWFLYPEVVRFFSGILDHGAEGVVILYVSFLLCYIVAYVNLVVSIVFVMFIGKDTSKLIVFHETAAGGALRNDKTQVFQRTVTVMYYFNAWMLCSVKILLLVVFAGHWLQSGEYT